MGTAPDDIIEQLFNRAREDEDARAVAAAFADARTAGCFTPKELEARVDALVEQRTIERQGTHE